MNPDKLASDLVDLAESDPRLKLDIRYAGSNNFSGHPVYPSACAWLQRPAAAALHRAHDRARTQGFGFVVFDAYRPWRITRQFWDQFPAYRDFFADPDIGSVHNRGCAVDLSLIHLNNGSEVAMPSGYDEFTERAYPSYSGGPQEPLEMRDRLRGWMEAEGFSVHPREWWHFDFRDWEKYPVLDIEFSELH